MKKLLTLFTALVLVLGFYVLPQKPVHDVEAVISLSKFKKTRVKFSTGWVKQKIPANSDGYSYKIKWKAVSGAKGYQYKITEVDGGTYTRTGYKGKNSRSYTFSASSVRKFSIKVRAYRVVKGKKVYSLWSVTKTKTMW